MTVFASDGTVCGKERISEIVSFVARSIVAEFGPVPDVILIGIQRRGVPFARRLSAEIEKTTGVKISVGTLDIGMYRDDIGMRKNLPQIQETRIPDINGKTVILADDVIQAGRSIRAALDAVNDFGRPSIIRLAVLFDRGGREFPIAADYVGDKINIPEKYTLSVLWDEIDGCDCAEVIEKTSRGDH